MTLRHDSISATELAALGKCELLVRRKPAEGYRQNNRNSNTERVRTKEQIRGDAEHERYEDEVQRFMGLDAVTAREARKAEFYDSLSQHFWTLFGVVVVYVALKAGAWEWLQSFL